MGAVSVVIGGVVGLIAASLMYASGAGLVWTLVGYAVVGHGVAALLMLRYYRREPDFEARLAREMEVEMEALREYHAQGALVREPILFRSLRLQQQMNDQVGKVRSTKLW